MRILRRHAGYTTNSSASSEWVWPPPEPPGAEKDQEQEGAAGSASPGQGGDSAGPASPERKGEAAPAPRPPERQSPLVDNVLIIGGLCLAVLGVFALERLIRRWLRRRRSEDV